MSRRNPPGNGLRGLRMWIPPPSRRSGTRDEEEEKDGSDMQMSTSEEDAEDDIDAEGKEEAEDAIDVEPEPSEPESTPSSPPPAAYPRLKIKLKLPTSTPSFSASTSQPPSRRSPSRDVDIESEDDSSGDNLGSSDSEAAILAPKGKGKTKKPMTARQAVLASVAGSSQIKLLEPTTTSTKKKHLTDSELALRREETARKRKNLSEKKLEDEKAETINRLLKKQSRPQAKNKRITASSTNVPTPAQGGSDAEEAEVEGEVGDAEDGDHGKPEPEMYRWVSSAAGLSFSVPVNFLASPPDGPVTDLPSKVSGSKQVPMCDVSDCSGARKYRLVADMQKGACGMEHLKALEGRV